MFDVNKIAKEIRNARNEKNMTQMDLADAMGVSYQAVSNWERGNSMPDISKIADLCEVLDITVDKLIGKGKSAVTVQKVIDNREADISLEELVDVAPIMPPKKVEKVVEENQKKEEKINIKAMIPLAPFLDDDYLTEIAENVAVNDLSQVVCIAPFLNDDALERIVLNYNGPVHAISGLGPFLDDVVLDKLVDRYLSQGDCDVEELVELCPFLDEKTIRKIAEFAMKNGNHSAIADFAPFM